MDELASTCANCGDVLAGEYCSRCGQRAIDLHQPLSALFSDVVGDILNLDTRLVRTLRLLMLKPGAVANSRGGRTNISLPRHIAYYDDWYQGVKARSSSSSTSRSSSSPV